MTAAAGRPLLLVSTSPRTTWLWAADSTAHNEVRRALASIDAVARDGYLRGQVVPLVTDVEIGWDAGTSMEALRELGYRFRWHLSQDPRNCRPTLRGVEVEGQ